MASLLEVALFIRACIETARLNRAGAATSATVFMVPAGGYPASGGMYYVPMQMQHMQQMPQQMPGAAQAPHYPPQQHADPAYQNIHGYYAPNPSAWPPLQQQEQRQQPEQQQQGQQTASTPQVRSEATNGHAASPL